MLGEFDTKIDSGREVRAHDSTADMHYLILPMQPAGTEGWWNSLICVYGLYRLFDTRAIDRDQSRPSVLS